MSDEFKPRERYQDYKLKRYRGSMIMLRGTKAKPEPMTAMEREILDKVLDLADELGRLRSEFNVLKDRLTRKGVI
mgnify:CR=1 FL=1